MHVPRQEMLTGLACIHGASGWTPSNGERWGGADERDFVVHSWLLIRLALWVEACSYCSSKLSVSQLRGSCLLRGDPMRKLMPCAGCLTLVLDVGPLLGSTEGLATVSPVSSDSCSLQPVLW